MASVNKEDRIANVECIVKDLVVPLTMLGEADYQYWHNQLSVLSRVLRIRPDVKLVYQLPGFVSPVAVESSEDISKVTASSKRPAAISQPVASTSQECPADIGSGDSILAKRDIAVEDVSAPSKHSQSIAFRKLRSQTVAQFKTESKRCRLDVPSSIRQDVCIVCRKIDPDVNLDENTEWVQCDGCDRWSHKHCAANYNHPWYYCVHCISQ
ncbi:hypothetical protein FGIG_07606 [Fasciola gigantica]|uniref:Zinc finger PHD-type domain-containing protein n=1 Tax=Fasciola gigantica TaxID=46835 RepID=A0A504YW19_FASGI|nr:hypothetical protein FGIG_07606 [Fasciola gigantica]